MTVAASLEFSPPPGGMSEWLKETGCKPVGSAYAGSNPAPPTSRARPSGVAAATGVGVRALRDSRAQARAPETTGHRPWPLPDGPWFMGQSWKRLLFAHWKVPVERLSAVVPPQLPIDTFEGAAWIGVTPFTLTGFRLRCTLPAPWISNFEELNVRTYVTVGGKPGIYFLSLDAARRLAVEGARRLYRLPYFHAAMSSDQHDGAWIDYHSRRIQRDGPEAELHGQYRPVGDRFQASPGTLEYWLTERYCLYTLDEEQRVHRGEIHHPPWPLQAAEAEFALNTMAAPFGIELAGRPLLHFAARQDVVVWPLARVE